MDKLPEPYYQTEDGMQTIYCGDSLELLPLFEPESVDLVLTDPPYGIAHSSNHICETTTAAWMNQQIENDGSTLLRDYVLSQFKEWACFGSLKAAAPQCRATIIWDKGSASGMGDLTLPWKMSYELIFINGKGWCGNRDEGVIKNCWIVTRKSMGRTHPNEKPVKLMRYLIEKHTAKNILDPFLGSGTTLVACQELGRRGIGIEIEEKYCEIAKKRLRQMGLPGINNLTPR